MVIETKIYAPLEDWVSYGEAQYQRNFWLEIFIPSSPAIIV